MGGLQQSHIPHVIVAVRYSSVTFSPVILIVVAFFVNTILLLYDERGKYVFPSIESVAHNSENQLYYISPLLTYLQT